MNWLAYGAFTCALMLSSTASAAGPFGINMGDQPEQFGCKQSTENKLIYTCDEVPTKHPEMDMYVVRSTPKSGICWIKGVTKDIDTNSFGFSLQTAADKLSSQIAKKYDTPEKSDFLQYGSIWKDSNDWMMGLLKKERIYSYTWENPKSDNNVRTIYLSAQALDQSTGYIGVEFRMNNYSACKEAEENAGAGAF